MTGGVNLAFAADGDRVPGTLNTDNVTLGFTVATPIPVGGTIVLALPVSYFSAVDSGKVNTVHPAGATCTCTLAKATGAAVADVVTCTTAGAAVAVGAQILTLIA